jgi:hypothetical protein
VSLRAPSERALQVAVVVEALWAILAAYEAHDVYAGPSHGRFSLPWDVQVLNFARTWAEPAIAIVVIVWLADHAVRELRR